MKKTVMPIFFAALLLMPSLGVADEIESNFAAGYRMGFFMAVAAINPEKLCGNVHFLSMSDVIRTYSETHGANYPLKPKEVLDLEMKYFACPKAPSTSSKDEKR